MEFPFFPLLVKLVKKIKDVLNILIKVADAVVGTVNKPAIKH